MVEQGFAIGNGLTNPEIQYKAYTDYALNMKLIQKTDYDRINKMIPACEQAIKTCGTSSFILFWFFYLVISLALDKSPFGTITGAEGGDGCMTSYVTCNNIFNTIMDVVGGTNVRKLKTIKPTISVFEIALIIDEISYLK